jgi:hypothetical protein
MLCGVGLAHATSQGNVVASNMHTNQGGSSCGGGELLRMARILIDGYEEFTPLEQVDRDCIGDLWFVRVATEIILSSMRVAEGLETPERSDSDREGFIAQLLLLHNMGTSARRSLDLFCAEDFNHSSSSTIMIDSNSNKNKNSRSTTHNSTLGELVRRREAVIGPGSEPLSYGEEPVLLRKARGVWIYDENGRKLLDCYNNVCI